MSFEVRSVRYPRELLTKARWYALRTRARAEKRVDHFLRKGEMEAVRILADGASATGELPTNESFLAVGDPAGGGGGAGARDGEARAGAGDGLLWSSVGDQIQPRDS